MTESNITTILLMRHGAAKDGFLTEDSEIHAEDLGAEAKAAGLTIDGVLSSPQPRAVQTAVHFMKGQGKAVPVQTDESVGDSVLGVYPFTSNEIASMKAQVTPESILEEIMLESPENRPKLERRGKEGADAIVEFAQGGPAGQTILVTSHGASRLEAMLAHLSGDPLENVPRFGNCDIVVVKLTDSGNFISYQRFEPQAQAAAAPTPEK